MHSNAAQSPEVLSAAALQHLHGVVISMLGCRFGMRGRLWLLWSTMTFGGIFTCLIGTGGDSFGKTIAFVILAAIGIEV